MRTSKRYPGVNYFREADKNIFCGREEDSQRLFNLLYINETVVLHASSGIGKSSLIRAGLTPLIRSYNLEKSRKQKLSQIVPVVINFGISTVDTHEKNILIDHTIDLIRQEITKNEIEIESLSLLKEQKSLWYIAKQLQQSNFNLLLIFDQFEEIESYTKEQIDFFSKELAKLFLLNLPSEYKNELINEVRKQSDNNTTLNNQISTLEKRLDCGSLFVIRKDKLGVLTRLKKYLPNILKTDYLLKPLTETNARKAIILPSQVEGNYTTKKFTIHESVVDKIIKELKDSKTQLIEPLQIQIICSSLEEKIKGRKNTIGVRDLPPIHDILEEFYWKTWEQIKKKTSLDNVTFNKSKIAVLSKLIINKKRATILEDAFNDIADGNIIVENLHLKGFLNRNVKKNNNYYEISHDRLLAPALDDLKEQKEYLEYKEKLSNSVKKNRRTILNSIIIVTITILCSILYKSKKNAVSMNQDKVLTISRLTRNENNTTAYKLTQNYIKAYKQQYISALFPLNNLEKYLQHLDSTKSIYITNRFPIEKGFVSVNKIDSTGTFIVTNRRNSSEWETSPLQIKSTNYFKDQLLYRKNLKQNTYIDVIYSNSDSIKVQNSEGHSLGSFPFNWEGYKSELENIDVSFNANFIILKDSVYNLKSGQFLGSVTKYSDMKDQMISRFLHNEKYIAIGYWSGYVLVFDVFDLDDNGRFRVHKILEPLNGNSVVTSLAIDHSDTYLYSGNRSGNILKYNISSLNKDEIKKLTIEHIANLEAHPSEINSLCLSDNDSLLLSAGKAKNVILWATKNDSVITYLRGAKSEVLKAGFLDTLSQFYTVTKNNNLYTWGNKTTEQPYISPYDYKYLGFLNKTWKTVYNKKTVENKYHGFINYITSIPTVNAYPESIQHHTNLKNSIAELQEMIESIRSDLNFEKGLTKASKRLLNQKEIELKYKLTPDLLSWNTKDTQSNFEYFKAIGENYLKDSIDHTRDKALIGLSNIVDQILFDFYEDKCDNIETEKLLTCLHLIEKISNNQSGKEPNLDDIKLNKKNLYTQWYNTSVIALLDDNCGLSTQAVKKCLALNQERKDIYTILICGYILNGDWDEATSLLNIYKDSEVITTAGASKPFNELLYDTIKLLQEKGIHHLDFDKVLKMIDSGH